MYITLFHTRTEKYSFLKKIKGESWNMVKWLVLFLLFFIILRRNEPRTSTFYPKIMFQAYVLISFLINLLFLGYWKWVKFNKKHKITIRNKKINIPPRKMTHWATQNYMQKVVICSWEIKTYHIMIIYCMFPFE